MDRETEDTVKEDGSEETRNEKAMREREVVFDDWAMI